MFRSLGLVRLVGRSRSRPRQARLLLSSEPLERRALLAVDFAGPMLVSQLDWQGSQVSVQADSWIVRASATALAIDLPGGAGWQSKPLGEGFYSLTAPGASVVDVLGWATATTTVDYVEPDFAITSSARPNDPMFSQLWGLANTGGSGGLVGSDIAATAAWDVTTGSRSVVVAVIDTGVDYTHPDLAANMWRNPREIAGDGLDNDSNGFIDDIYGWNFAGRNGNPMDDQGHGTHVAGTIGAVGNNGTGVTGVNWNVSIMALKFLDADGSGSTSDAIAAINYATRMRRDFGINVVATNNSWGGGGASIALRDAIAAGGRAGTLFVAAAGNESANNDQVANYPSNYPDDSIIAVAATDRAERLASFSNYGATTVDVAAPGVSIVSTVPNARYASYSGTSMATPQVAGTIALMAAANPDATAAQLRSALLSTTRSVAGLAGRVVTGGVINAAAAVQAIRVGGPPAPPPTDPPPGEDPEPPPPPSPPAPVVDVGDTLLGAFRVTATSGQVRLAGIVGDGSFGRRDVDFYRVRVAKGQTLVIQTIAERLPGSSSLDTFLRVFDSRGRQIAANDDSSGTLDSRIVIRPQATGFFFIGVSGYGNSRYNPNRAGSGVLGSTGRYELGLTFGPMPGKRAIESRGNRIFGAPDPIPAPAGQSVTRLFAALASHVSSAALSPAAAKPRR